MSSPLNLGRGKALKEILATAQAQIDQARASLELKADREKIREAQRDGIRRRTRRFKSVLP